ncbi:hypothetical protein jhhlp_003343 [Lomentospora prolificans]|uniref:DNA mismatch repair protein PMS1 n=1 Tax=Lomentospora prolificans TaxID=41688 RepID=A0A2N3NGM6_9PEZI|nr:hypothetical protein jhhlp_003343 [Lomentospora prolificans]
MATIKPIDKASIHRIQSGQVIVDLCSVAKELVENSVDAGASSIEVRFKNQGLDSIEVQDNGTGIAAENYESIALKHYTSKLSVYDDLSDLQTFGFRGEALSSLSALSHLSITTCMADDVPKGSKLRFAASGSLESTSVVPAKQGTTIVVENLFHNLPVRRRELERHIKREWAKVISLLNQYACILTDVKFTVSQQPTKGKKIVLFSTKGNPTTRENIVNIFGAKTMTALIPLDLVLEMEPTTSRISSRNSKENPCTNHVVVKGHVSRPAHGEGRQAPDRQMFFVNGRPCGLPQFAKVFNEVYKAFNSSQSPFIFADIQLDTHLYDVNVSPDKRTILLHEQGRMLDHLKESLNTLFEGQDYTVPAFQLTAQRTPSTARTTATSIPARSSVLSSSPAIAISTPTSRSTSRVTETSGVPGHEEASLATDEPNEKAPFSSLLDTLTARKPTSVVNASDEPTTPASSRLKGIPKPTAPHDSSTKSIPVPRLHDSDRSDLDDDFMEDGPGSDVGSESDSPPRTRAGLTGTSRGGTSPPTRTRERPIPTRATVAVGDQTTTGFVGISSSQKTFGRSIPISSFRSDERKAQDPPRSSGRLAQILSAARASKQNTPLSKRKPGGASLTHEESGSSAEEDSEDVADEDQHQESEDSIRSDEGDGYEPNMSPKASNTATKGGKNLEAEASSDEMMEGGEQDGAEAEPPPLAFTDNAARSITRKPPRRGKVSTLQYEQNIRLDAKDLQLKATAYARRTHQSSPSANEAVDDDTDMGIDDAEKKLTLSISKKDFSKMKIIGQFNLGFIIVVRPAGGDDEENASGPQRRDELFIIDQHASDEKYNFERLQASTVVESQRLVHPKTLDLTALEEEIVLNNIPALEANGFKVALDLSGDSPVGGRCQLLALPLSKETTFGLPDLEELISLLGETHATSDTTAMPRPSKVRKMFAMRACRSSIMIGRPLQYRRMERLVRHMGELDKPWNCPHGRPTMRHLCNLDSWGAHGWAGDSSTAASGQKRSWADYMKGE